jgi:transcriptional regulator with XRE-family HTH domain
VARPYDPQRALGIALREAREGRQFTQSQLARRANVDKTWISHLESGTANPSWGTLRRICAALEIRISDLAAAVEAIEKRDR